LRIDEGCHGHHKQPDVDLNAGVWSHRAEDLGKTYHTGGVIEVSVRIIMSRELLLTEDHESAKLQLCRKWQTWIISGYVDLVGAHSPYQAPRNTRVLLCRGPAKDLQERISVETQHKL
jgi:hypothetical protein